MQPPGSIPATSEIAKTPLAKPSNSPNLYDLYFVCSKKMKLILALGIGLAFLSVVGACLFRNPTLFMYPLHASCNITWTFQQDCTEVRDRVMRQINAWKDDSTCGSGQKCLYTLGEVKDNEVHSTHTSPTKAQNVDDMQFKFYRNSATGGCNVIGYSTSRLYFALLDFGTNYCNLHNLMQGSGLTSDPHYSELTRDEICTQYTSANCDKY